VVEALCRTATSKATSPTWVTNHYRRQLPAEFTPERILTRPP